MIWIGSTNF